MREVEPKVFAVAATALEMDGVEGYLEHIGASQWDTTPCSDAEFLIELMGRSCYKAFGTELNPNLTRVREGNEEYVRNIVNSHHGSVLEHVSISFMFCDVSRVFTHELVRHRVGTAMSQESLRFVRLTDLGFWAPTVIRESAEALDIMSDAFRHLEGLQTQLADLLIDEDTPFSTKKVITSAMRRIAPIGLATNIGWTANLRTLRWVIQERTHPKAEEEIRIVFGKVAQIAKRRYPAVFADFVEDVGDGHPHFHPEHAKV